jgi:hybrid cluster-associated redox disulfide protein
MITKDMLIGDIVEKFPQVVPIIMMSGMGCIGCSVAASETLEEGCAAHGIDADDLVSALNDALKENAAAE